MLLKKRLVYTIDRFFSYPERGVYEHIEIQGKAYQSQRQEPCVPLLCGYAPVPVHSGSPATEHGTAHAYRLGAFQFTK